MRTQEIDEQAWTPAGAELVYGLLARGATWPEWSGIDSFALEQPGDGAAEGLNAIRVFRTGRVTSRERLVELVPGRRLSYAVLSGLPLVGYRADVDLTPVRGGTTIRWHSTFAGRRPGTGWLYRLMLGRFIRNTVRGLARHATSLDVSSR
jgi:hypothetical protein